MKENEYRASRLLRELGVPVRYQIAKPLEQGAMTVGQISAALGRSRTTISHHLHIHRAVDVVGYETKGRNVVYRLKASLVPGLLAPGFPPAITLAEASDNVDSIPGIDPDDYVLLEFDEPTNKPPIDYANIDNVFQLSGGHTWLDGFGEIGSALWNGPGDLLLVTLSTTAGPPTVAVGDTITPDGGTITDALGNPCVSQIEITGSFGEPTGVEESRARIARTLVFALSQSSPNPFYQETEIRYAIPVKSEVSLKVYDLTGRLVRTLVQEEVGTGVHAARWDGRDEADSPVPGGVYLYRLAAGDFAGTRKVILVR